MTPKELITAGRLEEARSVLVDTLKKQPADPSARSLLFQLLLFFGEWDKARRHLEISASQGHSTPPEVDVYTNLIQAEKSRLAVAGLTQRPTFFPEVPAHADAYIDVLELIAAEKSADARAALEKVYAGLTHLRGMRNGEPFSGFVDTDTTLALFIEAIEYERYLWVPVHSIRELVVSPPKTLIDLIWTKARITTWEGLTMGCFLPVLYPRSFESTDNRIRMGRMTDWVDLGNGLARAVGQHVYQVGNSDKTILELGEVIFHLDGSQAKGK
jgi:type VI secretion system protein ImpE